MIFSRGLLIGMLAGLLLIGCTPGQVDRATGAAANVDLIRQCGELQRELDLIEKSLTKVTEGEIDRLEEINAIRTVVCTADLREMTAAVRLVRERVE